MTSLAFGVSGNSFRHLFAQATDAAGRWLILMLLGLTALASFAEGQTIKKRGELSVFITRLTGRVTDRQGNPLAEVHIDHTGVTRPPFPVTDAQGRFAVETRASAVVFRKNGFEGQYYPLERDAIAVELKLQAARPAKACSPGRSCLSVEGLLPTFCLPRVRGIRVTKQGNDIDYGYRFHLVETPQGEQGIQHAAGPLWGSGMPLDDDVWTSVEYQETDYRDAEGYMLIDARGRSAQGECWRVVGHAFETAAYRRVSPETAKKLDRVLDGVCVRPWRRR